MPAIWIDGARVRLVSVVRAQGAAPDVVEGRLIFQENCAECHRSDGRGGGSVPRLQAYPRGAEKRFIETVLHGRNSYGMPPWEGLLSEAQIRSVLEYVRALAPTVEVARGAPVEDQARQVFGQVCATCHGPAGAGTRLAPSLHAFKGTDDEFVSAVLDGRPGTAMAPFRSIVSAEMARTIREYVRGLSRLN
jgi:cytochrome c oxidase cbb3-type subunit 3